MLSGKVAVITGSCSGLGAEIARYLSSRGASVVINYPWESLKTAADEVAKTLAGPHIMVAADLSTVDGPKHLIETAAAKFGRIDILVNNASYAIFKPMDEYTLEDFEGLVNTNCRGYFLVTQAVLPHLSPKNSRIINIVSSDSRFPSPNHSLYSGSKGMQDSFVRTWAKELPPKYGCTVNAVSPGPSATPPVKGILNNADKFPLDAANIRGLMAATPIGNRLMEPVEIAYAVGMLCEDGASGINGLHMHVNGGLFAD